MLRMKGTDILGTARDQRRRDELRKLHDGKLFGVLAQGTGLVEDLGPLALRLTEHVRGIEELGIERRVFAHDDGVKVCQHHLRRLGFLEPSPLVPCQGDMPHPRHDLGAALPGDVAGLTGHDLVTSALSLTHHGKGGVLVYDKGFQRIGDKQYFHGEKL